MFDLFREEREVASAALAVSLRVHGIDTSTSQVAQHAQIHGKFPSRDCPPNTETRRPEEGIPPFNRQQKTFSRDDFFGLLTSRGKFATK